MTEVRDLFPARLLDASIEERKKYFRDFVVYHEHLVEAIRQTLVYVTSLVPERIVFVIGPSGVGKKVLIEAVKAKLLELAKPRLTENPGCIPVVDVEAMAPLEGSFDFPRLCRRALEKMNEPMLDHKIRYDDVTGFDSQGRIVLLSKKRKADYQEVLQDTLKYREVLAFIIDEGQNLLSVASGKKVNWSVDVIKSLANVSHTPIVMVGTDALMLFLRDLDIKSTDQINQRTRIVYYPPYNSKVTRERNIFGKTAKKLLRHMPLEQTSEELVDDHWEYLYEWTSGCIGTLKIWLMDAYAQALKSKAKKLTREHLETIRLLKFQKDGLEKSIKTGKERMKKLEDDTGLNLDSNESNNNLKTHHSKKKTKPGTRNPKRDVVMQNKE